MIVTSGLLNFDIEDHDSGVQKRCVLILYTKCQIKALNNLHIKLSAATLCCGFDAAPLDDLHIFAANEMSNQIIE